MIDGRSVVRAASGCNPRGRLRARASKGGSTCASHKAPNAANLSQIKSRLNLMPFNTGAVLTALVSCLCRLTVAAGEPAYLPAVGPPPLRFALPPAAPTVAVSLPPLVASASAPESVVPATVAGDPAQPVAAATNAPEVKLVSPPEYAPGTQPPGSNKPEEPPISSFLFP